MADTVTIHFKGNASGEYPRAVVRAIFGLVDNVLQDLGEPNIITVPVPLKSFEKLHTRALNIMRGQDPVPCCAKASSFLLYNFDDAAASAALILDTPALRAMATSDGLLIAIVRADRNELIDETLTVFSEARVAEAIARYKAEKCLTDWLAKSRNIGSMLPVATTKNIYGPLIRRVHRTRSLWLLKLATPAARRYSYRSRCGLMPGVEIYRIYLDAAVRLDDRRFTAALKDASRFRFSGTDSDGHPIDVKPKHVLEIDQMYAQLQAEFLRDEHADLYATMRDYEL